MKIMSLKFFGKSLFATALIAMFVLLIGSSVVPVKRALADCQGQAGYHEASPGSPLCLPDTAVKGGFADKTSIGQLILSVIQVLLILSAVVAILFIIIGGFRYMVAGGNQEQTDKGKKMITGAVVGLIVIVLSYTIVNILIRTVTTGDVLGTGGTGTTTTTCPPGVPKRSPTCP